jgi:hypothetical protein
MYRLTLVILALALLLALAAGTVAGQTTSPTATPTGVTATPSTTPVATPTGTVTPTVPAAQDLLDSMNTAMTARNTYHIAEHQVAVIRKQMRDVVDARSDESIKPLMARLKETDHVTTLSRQPPTTTVRHSTTILVKKRGATRTNHGAWQCINLGKIQQQVGSVVSSLVGSAHLESEDTLGLETVNSVPVWHVRVLIGLSSQKKPLTSDYYISQSDRTLVRETVSGTLTILNTSVTESILEDYSRYGESVHITLPAACAATKLSEMILSKGHVPSLPADTLRLAVSLWNDARLAAHLRR